MAESERREERTGKMRCVRGNSVIRMLCRENHEVY
jgi:hypothetical protein